MIKLLSAISCLIILACFTCNAHAQSLLTAEKNAELSRILNNLEIIASTDKEYSIRVIRVGEYGECDGTPQSCPQESLYIAVSEYGEYPDYQVYVLPRAHGWDFERWVALPKHDGRDDFAVLRLVKRVVSADITKRWWDQEAYELKVNPWKGYIEFKARSGSSAQDSGKPVRAGKAASKNKKK
ncbi:MAG: hypothetical protein V2A77_00535 [Pseudomonadota bacterium]